MKAPTGHGTLDEYLNGCDCADCAYAHRFLRLAEKFDDSHNNTVRKFGTPKVNKSRPFPARDLVIRTGFTSCTEIAGLLGVSRQSVSHWLRNGACFTVWDADKYACKIGLHPVMVWGEKWLGEGDDA